MWFAALHGWDRTMDGRAMAFPHGSIPTTITPTALEHRARRLDMVVRELRKRVRHHPAPHLIGQAIEGLEVELTAVRRQLG
jgi:hypothetical protein